MTTRSRFPSYYNKKNATSEAVVDSTVSDNDENREDENREEEEEEEDNLINEEVNKDYVYGQPS